ISPLDSRMFAWQYYTGLAHFCAGRSDEATDWVEKALRDQRYSAAVRLAAAVHALSGRNGEAQKRMAQLRELLPRLRIATLDDVMPPFRRRQDRDRLIDGLRKAGLPE